MGSYLQEKKLLERPDGLSVATVTNEKASALVRVSGETVRSVFWDLWGKCYDLVIICSIAVVYYDLMCGVSV
jgi:hypothetical protein